MDHPIPNHTTDMTEKSASTAQNIQQEPKVDPNPNVNKINESLQRVLQKQSDIAQRKRRFVEDDVERENRNMRRKVSLFELGLVSEESFQPTLEENLEVEEELEEAQRNLLEAREERKAAQREREEARRERLEAQKDRESARKERQKARSDRLAARTDRLNAKKERDESRLKRSESQRKRQEARLERLQLEMELNEAQVEREIVQVQVEEAQIEIIEANAEREEAEKERQEAQHDINEVRIEQTEIVLEEAEEFQERLGIQNIKMEAYYLGTEVEKAEKYSPDESAVVVVDISARGGITSGVCETVIDDQTFEFRCPECGNGYNKRSSFMRHVKTHAIAEHECNFCKKMFVRVDVLRRHLKNMHGVTAVNIESESV